MAKVRMANRLGAARDDPEFASPGYAANGESQFSREATHGGGRRPVTERHISDLSRLDVLILKQVRQVARLERRLDEAGGDVMEVAQITERLYKTRRFLDRLRAEQSEGAEGGSGSGCHVTAARPSGASRPMVNESSGPGGRSAMRPNGGGR